MLCSDGLAEKSLGADRDSRAVRLSNERSIGGMSESLLDWDCRKKLSRKCSF